VGLRGVPGAAASSREQHSVVIPLLFLPLAYLLGATPTSYWVGKALHGVDLRQVGSGNLGATNTFRALGWKAALPVMLVDVLKGWVPVAVFPLLGGGGAGTLWVLAYGAAAILGHVFSFWVGFRGGKGVATSAGVFLGLAPWAVLLALGVWLAVVFSTRIVSLGSIAAALILPPAVALTPTRGGSVVFWFTLVLALFVIFAHRQNIRRLLRGEEHRFVRTGAPGRPGEATAESPGGGGTA